MLYTSPFSNAGWNILARPNWYVGFAAGQSAKMSAHHMPKFAQVLVLQLDVVCLLGRLIKKVVDKFSAFESHYNEILSLFS